MDGAADTGGKESHRRIGMDFATVRAVADWNGHQLTVESDVEEFVVAAPSGLRAATCRYWDNDRIPIDWKWLNIDVRSPGCGRLVRNPLPIRREFGFAFLSLGLNDRIRLSRFSGVIERQRPDVIPGVRARAAIQERASVRRPTRSALGISGLQEQFGFLARYRLHVQVIGAVAVGAKGDSPTVRRPDGIGIARAVHRAPFPNSTLEFNQPHIGSAGER